MNLNTSFNLSILALILSSVMVSNLDAGESVATEIKLTTIVPSGTTCHKCLMEMGDAWRTASAQNVRLTVYAGSGDGEALLVKKMRTRQIHAALLSVVGISEIDKSVTSLQLMPMMFRNWQEVDYVREKVRPDLERRLREKGYVVLFWADAGWARFFSKAAGIHPDDYRKMKMFVWASDSEQMAIMRKLGCQPVGLETQDILPGLSTDMIEAMPVPAFMANALQYNRSANHMLDVNWVPIVGAAIIRRDTWENIPPGTQKELIKSARAAGEKMRARTRAEDDEAVAAMKKRGLVVQHASPQVESEWRAFAEKAYPMIRGSMVPAELFDRVEGHLKEFRAAEKDDHQ